MLENYSAIVVIKAMDCRSTLSLPLKFKEKNTLKPLTSVNKTSTKCSGSTLFGAGT